MIVYMCDIEHTTFSADDTDRDGSHKAEVMVEPVPLTKQMHLCHYHLNQKLSTILKDSPTVTVRTVESLSAVAQSLRAGAGGTVPTR